MRRTSIFLLLLGLSACGTNEVRPRPSGHGPCIDEADADDQQSQTPPNASDGGVSNAPTNADAGVNAISPDSSVATLSPSPRCDGLVCDVFASCVGGDEPRCTCAPGLEGDGQRCSDIDECQQEAAVCSANAACENSFGGYSCRCNPGYKRQGDGCVADDACTASVCAADATCGEGEGQLSCVCDEASSGNGFFCTTMQPCADTPCGDDGACIAAAGAERDFVCACDQGYFGERSCAACGEELSIDDPELDRAVRQQLGLAPADARPILVAELSAYTALDASEFGVTNLAGLECWPALRVLDLSYNPALANEGAQVLASLNQLTELRLDCTLVTDLHVLDGHPNLRVLSLNVLNCDEPVRIDETSPLGTMPQLEVLDVRGQRLTDASVLSALRNLRALWFGHNQLSSLGELPELPLLVELDVSFNQLGAIDEVARFSRLQYLNVSNNELVSLTPTESLSALRNVNASGNRVSTLPDWRDSDVVQIDVSANQIAAIGPLADLNRVAWVNIAANAITTLQPLLEGSLRGTLVVAGNPAACGEESSVIAELRAIGIDVQGQCTE